MTNELANLNYTAPPALSDLSHHFGAGLPPSLQILLNTGVYDRIKQLAVVMSKAQGITPRHLIGMPEACFAVINIALDAKLNPHFVARHTYQTPSGQIGYDGALVHAMLEASGRFIGAPRFEYVGDWTRLVGKHAIKTSQKGNQYVAPTWTSDDAVGLGVIVHWQARGEDAPRVWPGPKEPFQLVQCFPLNSPLWATDPKTQIAYLAIRRFANQAAPGILGAAAFDEGELLDASDRARDVTPRRDLDQPATRAEPVRSSPTHQQIWEIVDLDGNVRELTVPAHVAALLAALIEEATLYDLDRLEGWWSDNIETVQALAAAGHQNEADQAMTAYASAVGWLREQAERRKLADEALDLKAREQLAADEAAAAPQDAATAPEARQAVDDRFPGDLPAGERLAPPQSAPERMVPRQAEPSVPAEQTEDRPNYAVPMVLTQGKPDHRRWLTIVMVPTMRRHKTTADLAHFLGDNSDEIEAAQRVMPAAEFAEWKAAVATQWQRIDELEKASAPDQR